MAKVSIGVPVYNGERYLDQALSSIAEQTHTDLEIVIADNASEDNTEEIAREHCRRDPRFRFWRHPENLGAAYNYNFVYGKSTGALFKWAAHDDLLRPTYIERCVHALLDDRRSVLAFPGTLRIDSEGREIAPYTAATRWRGGPPHVQLDDLIGRGDPFASHLHKCFPVFGILRRDALERTSLIANFPRSDRLLLVELALLGEFRRIDEFLFLRREHDEGSVIAAEHLSDPADLERVLARWFDPRAGERFPATGLQLAARYSSAVARLPSPPAEKIRCARVLAGWLGRHARVLGGELKIVARERVRRR